jgi:hypothetical protein
MDRIKKILLEAMEEYAIAGLNGMSYLMQNEAQDVFTVITLAKFQGKRFINTGLIVHIVDNTFIVIEEDINNKPLVDALVQAGIPRDKIILAYAGETVPEEADFGSAMSQPEEPITA